MADIRFEILINGISHRIIGTSGYSVLSVNVNYVTRDPNRYEEEKKAAPADWNCPLEEWVGPHLDIQMGGLDCLTSRHLAWMPRSLKVDDEITIRVLGAGEIDTPDSRQANSKSNSGA
ncbi:MAG: hypothetical protein HZA46_22995 [Planctomycetales bacterium]|nr:hypothetical protein [Planctomycetales bacterium]